MVEAAEEDESEEADEEEGELLEDCIDFRDHVEGVENEVEEVEGEIPDIEVPPEKGEEDRSETNVDVKLAIGDRSGWTRSFSGTECRSTELGGPPGKTIDSILGAEMDKVRIF